MRTARRHSNGHLDFIRQLPCIYKGCADDTTVEAAHYRAADSRIAKPITGIGIKPDDCFVLPLCGKHHRLQHEIGEYSFWHLGDPVLWSLALFAVSGDYEAGTKIIEAAFRTFTHPTEKMK